MLKIYGSMLCKDCVECRQELDAAKVQLADLRTRAEAEAKMQEQRYEALAEKEAPITWSVPCI